GSAGTTMAARIATIATTQTTSSKVNPSVPLPSALPARDVLPGAGATFCSIRTIGKDVVCAVLPRRAIDIRVAPGIGRDGAAFQVGSVPGRDVAGAAHQGGQALRAVRIAAGVEKEQVERAGEAFDLDLGRLGLRLGQIVEHARAD